MEHRDVSYLIYEATQARNERAVKRLVTALIITIVLMFASNAIWLYAWTQYDYIETEEELKVHISTEGGGDANYIGNDGDILNGENNSKQETNYESTNP